MGGGSKEPPYPHVGPPLILRPQVLARFLRPDCIIKIGLTLTFSTYFPLHFLKHVFDQSATKFKGRMKYILQYTLCKTHTIHSRDMNSQFANDIILVAAADAGGIARGRPTPPPSPENHRSTL